MFGDLYQLPPVVGDPELHKYFVENNGGFYFFNADVWENTSLDIYELMYIFRQEDNSFKEILNSLRKGKVNEELLKTINLRSKVEIPGKEVITLVTTNQLVNELSF